MILYHVDRKGSLHTGDILSLNTNPNIYAEHPELWKELFPEGLSAHGETYFSDHIYNLPLTGLFPAGEGYIACTDIQEVFKGLDSMGSGMCELVTELVRRSSFPAFPSRLQSLFCLSSIGQIGEWPELSPSNCPHLQLFEIEVSDKVVHTFDSCYLRGGFPHGNPHNELKNLYFGFSFLSTWSLATLYWSGQHSDKPRMECLVPLPVSIGKRIDL